MDAVRQAAIWIIQKLREHGHVAYLAGGSVRDTLLGRRPKDFDVATSAHPHEIRAVFPKAREVGEAFGVLLVRRGRHMIEVATFRKDGDYLDGRRPVEVTFCDARQDAHRRDFTINGLFEDPAPDHQPPTSPESPDTASSPETLHTVEHPPSPDHAEHPHFSAASGPSLRIIDYVGGLDDLHARLIRAIGDPHRRFAEDYLRMLRAIRFAARLNFDIEPNTAAAIRDFAPLLARISRERIGQELRWMLQRSPHETDPAKQTDPASASPADSAGRHPVLRAAELIQQLGLDAAVFSEEHHQPPLPTLARLVACETEPLPLRSDHPGGPQAASTADENPANPHPQPSPPGADSPDAAEAASDTDIPPPHEHDPSGPANMPRSLRYAVRLLAWMFDRHGRAHGVTEFDPNLAVASISRIVSRWRRALCLTNVDVACIRATLRWINAAPNWAELRIAERKRLIADIAAPTGLLTLRALGWDGNMRRLCGRIESGIPELYDDGIGIAPTPLITGADLIAAGLTPSPKFKQLIDEAYNQQLEGNFQTREQAQEWISRQP